LFGWPEIFVGMGIDKIRLTGGEPLARRDIGRIVERLGVLPGLKTPGDDD